MKIALRLLALVLCVAVPLLVVPPSSLAATTGGPATVTAAAAAAPAVAAPVFSTMRMIGSIAGMTVGGTMLVGGLALGAVGLVAFAVGVHVPGVLLGLAGAGTLFYGGKRMISSTKSLFGQFFSFRKAKIAWDGANAARNAATAGATATATPAPDAAAEGVHH